MTRVKGSKITSKIAFARAVYGDEAADRVLESLGEEDRQQVRKALEIGWYPHALYARVVDAVVDGPAGGDEKILDRLGEDSAERLGQGAYRAYYRQKDPAAMLEGMAPMHAMVNDPGEMAVEPRGEGHVSIVVTEPPGSHRVCRIARAFYKRSVELCGGGGVSVREVECSGRGDDACRFEVRWS